MFVAISRAFDRVGHDLVILDLAAIGVRELVLSWLCDCLSDRRQRVRIGDDPFEYATCLRGEECRNSACWVPSCMLVIYICKLAQYLPAEVSNQELADDHARMQHASVSVYGLPVAINCSCSTGGVVGGPWPVKNTQVMILQLRGASASPLPVPRGDELLPTVYSIDYDT